MLGADRRSAPSTNAAHVPSALGLRVWGLPWAPDRDYDGGVGPPKILILIIIVIG